MRLVISRKAEIDLEKIYYYTLKNWGLKQAVQYQNELFSATEYLLQHPEYGKKYSFSPIATYYTQKNKHLIFYRIENKTIFIVRILHQSMDIQSII